MPGAPPASPHTSYEEIGEPSSEEPGFTSDVREVVDDPLFAPEPTRPSASFDEDGSNPEESFADALRVPKDGAKKKLDLTAKRPAPKRSRRGGRLALLGPSGSVAGEAALEFTRTLVGRTKTADIQLDDPTVSLRHAEIFYEGGGRFTLADLGSTSGTLLNGLLLQGDAPLSTGDVIQIGNSELRFLRADQAPIDKPPSPTVVEPSAPADGPAPAVQAAGVPAPVVPVAPIAKEPTRVGKPAEPTTAAAPQASSPRRRMWRRAGVAVLVVLLSVLGIRALFSDSAPAQVRLQIAALLAQAERALQAGDVDTARHAGAALLALDPKNADGESLMRTVESEAGARDAVQLALRLGDEDRDDEASAALGRVADTSVFAKDRDRLRLTLEERAMVRSLRAIEGSLEQGLVDEALATAEKHVLRFPADESGKSLLARVRGIKGRTPKDPALVPARAAFADGRIDDARRIAQAAGYAGYVADLDRFAQALAAGQQALARFDGAAARTPLDEAFRLLAGLGGRASSPIFASVRKPYADALYLAATEKLDNGDDCGAARDLFKAARLSPDDRKVENALQGIAGRAEAGLTAARGARAQDKARAGTIARQTLCLASSGTATYEALAEIAR